MLSKLRRGMLGELLWHNMNGITPNKAVIVGFDGKSLVDNRVRSYRYKVVDQLIEDGYIQNKGTLGNYALILTPAGKDALNE